MARVKGKLVCRSTAFYPREFARRVLKSARFKENHQELLGELCDGIGNNHPNFDLKEDSFCFSLTPEEKNKTLQNIKRIHVATGHCNKDYLYRALKRRGIDEERCRLVHEFKCDICQETRRPAPRNKSTLEDLPPKWTRLQMDSADWQHPETGETFHFILGVDEGSRFRVGRFMHHGRNFSPSTQNLIQFFEAHWQPVFGKPTSIRLDPAGAYRSNALEQYMSDRHIMIDTIPGEAHWQNSLVERGIQFTKSMMTSLAKEYPEMAFQELLPRSLCAQNNHDQYLGFSPLQHAFGRGPDCLGHLSHDQMTDIPVLTESGISAEFGENVKAMIEAEQAFHKEQNKERLKRALLSGHRPALQVTPGDLVFYWRLQGSGTFKRGRFLGPARVLAVETRRDSDGSQRPSSVVWLVRGNKLFKAAPQQIRHASPREMAWAELEQPHQPLSWTISDLVDGSKNKMYEAIHKEWEEYVKEHQIPDQEPPNLEDLERELEDEDMPPEEPASASSGPSSEERPERSAEGSTSPEAMEEERPPASKRKWQAPLLRARKKTPGVEQLEEADFIGLASSEPSNHLGQEQACVSIEIDLPSGPAVKKKSWLRNFEGFIASQVKKNHIEISERWLTPEERQLFQAAKDVEVRNFILAKVFERLPDHVKPDRTQALKMRWVLTWKICPNTQNRKAKARAVVLGYLDPEYERRPSASPTVSRTSRQLFLQAAASFGYAVEKGDVSGAFLQGRRFNREVLCEPLPEICQQLGLPEGSLTLLTRAAYGLVEAPIEWYCTINEFLEELGFRRQQSDPCVWGLFQDDPQIPEDEPQTPIGWICSHVDDFMFAGQLSDPRWQEIRRKIQEKFRWGDWEKGSFSQCGVNIETTPSGGFCLSQSDFLDGVDEIHIPKKRWDQRGERTTDAEKQQMRSVLGCLSWHAGQLAMDSCASVGLLLSQVTSSIVEDLIEVNKVLKRAKARGKQKMYIHPVPPKDILVATWVDAAHANRPDGSSTKGVVIGCSSHQLLKGELDVVSPIYWTSSKITRICRSSASAETRAAVDGDDQMFAIRFQLGEFLGFPPDIHDLDGYVSKVPGVLISDAKNLYHRLSQTMLTLRGAEKRSDLESLCLKESMNWAKTQLRWVNGDSQLANSLTKPTEPHQCLLFSSRNCRWRIVYDSELMSGRRRKNQGLSALEPDQEGVSRT